MRVLVIEDDPDLGAWLRASVTQALGPCDVVTSLEEARAALAVAVFDLVVIDRLLPDGDGMGLIAELGALRRERRAGEGRPHQSPRAGGRQLPVLTPLSR
jgi:two-component system OmpR family response regulator